MIIGIDLQPLTRSFRGDHVSTRRMVESLLKIDSKNTYIFFNTRGIDGSFFNRFRSRNIEIIKGDITPQLSSKLDIYHIPNFFDHTKKQIFPSKLRCRTITTLHDMVPALFWSHYLANQSEEKRDDYVLRMGELEKFDGIITPSLCTKKDAMDLLGIDEGKIDIVMWGCPGSFKPRFSARESSRIMQKYGIRGKYILCTAGMDHRKNVFGLIEAYLMLSKRIRDNHQLVIVCEVNRSYLEDIFDFFEGRIKPNEIIFTDFVPERDLAVLYRNASLFAFPSFYEGFGLPVLEAMASGCPVVASNASSIPEVTGDAAILVNPYRKKEIARAMEKVLSDRRLARSMRKKGLRQASRFDWSTVAKNVLEIYAKTLKGEEGSGEKRSGSRTAMGSRRLGKKILKLGVVSVWNTKDGIATYTDFLLKGLSKSVQPVIFAKESRGVIRKDSRNVIRCWGWDDSLERLYDEIKNEGPDIVHFQFNFGYFKIDALLGLFEKLRNKGIKTMMTFHSTDDSNSSVKLEEARDEFAKVDRILVHTEKDMERMDALGLHNAEILPHGNNVFADRGKEALRKGLFRNSRIISTFGFPFPHKATVELIKALKIVRRKHPDALLIDMCSLEPDSTHIDIIRDYHDRCRRTASRLGLADDVLFFTEHLHDLEVIELLQASDVVAMPYKPTKDSTSAAVRYALASHRPVITTRTPIFSEFESEVYKIKDSSPKIIAAGILRIFEDGGLRGNIARNAEIYLAKNSWKNISRMYESMLRSTV